MQSIVLASNSSTPSITRRKPTINVQSPPIGSFDAAKLQWEARADPREKYQALFIAYIPWERTQDFIEGENNRSNAPTNFKVEWTKNRKPNTLKRPNEDSYLRLTGYVCYLK